MEKREKLTPLEMAANLRKAIAEAPVVDVVTARAARSFLAAADYLARRAT